MTKTEFLVLLSRELEQRGVADAAEVVEEYEQHFSYKLADGYSEEEIAARLGDPVLLAAQFEGGTAAKSGGKGRKVLTGIGLGFADVGVGAAYVLLIAWDIIMAALCILCGAIAVCLLPGWSAWGLIPAVPYGVGVVYAVALLALAVLAAIGFFYFTSFVRQLMRAYGRFHRNAMAAASGQPVLPSVSAVPQFSAKCRRRVRAAVLAVLCVFAVCFVLGLILSMLMAGAFEFWHVWGWFGYGA